MPTPGDGKAAKFGAWAEPIGPLARPNDMGRRLAVAMALYVAGWLPSTGVGHSSDYDRVAVIWSSIGVSQDRRTVTVHSSYPIDGGYCVKRDDGVELDVIGETAVVTAWLRGPDRPSTVACTAVCAFVRQRLKLPDALPPRVTHFQAPSHAVPGCADGWSERM